MPSPLAAWLIVSAFTPTQSPAFPRAKNVDTALISQFESQKLVGLSVGVIQKGKVVYVNSFGESDRDKRQKCDENTVMNWASNSKPMAGVLAMQLVEQKKLDLDADVRKYVPEWPDKGKTITVRHLLCHQSGIPHYANGKVVAADGFKVKDGELDPTQSIKRFLNSPLIFQPGEKAEYSSFAFVLLSAVIERAGGEAYTTQVRKRIQEPLKLSSLQLDGPSKGQKHWAQGYIKNLKDEIVLAPEDANDWKLGAGGYKSNVRDFATWAAALVDRKLVNDDSRKAMWTAQKLKNGETTQYGLGFVVSQAKNGFTISHNGGQAEVATRMLLNPKTGDGVVVMSNCRYASVAPIATAVLSAAFGE